MRTQVGLFAAAGLFLFIQSCSAGSGTSGNTGGQSGSTGGATGTGGGPSCAVGQSKCGTACVSLVSDASNCGACGTVCTGGQFCSQSRCSSSCASGETACGTSCANLTTDAANCGTCGTRCASGQTCSSGACVCASGQTKCGDACVDINSNGTNCGGCGKACATGQSCAAGVCVAGGGGTGGSTSTGGSTGITGGVGGSTGTTGGSTGTTGGVGGSTGTTGGTAGGTSTGGSGGGTVVGRNGCENKAGLIADFEEGVPAPAMIAHEGRTGEWEMFNDKSSTSQTMTVEASGGTAMCDKFALHVKGSGYATWGAGFGFSLVGKPTAPMKYDAAAQQFTGIRFKAKLGTGADPKSPVRFNISTPWTENTANPGGECTPTPATAEKAGRDCYQHAGRFLPPGAGEGELTQAWKTFTYCFDRDLYPLSLPSNLTNVQRETIATNMLKVQFQFNQGKDYTGAYTTMYPAFAKALPFDFWLDDVTFLKGECPNMTPSPSNGTPAKPFPQNAPVGTCAPATNAPKFASAIAQAYARWTRHFVQANNGIAAPEQQGAVTSEAMGYGMMIAAAMGDKAAFDKFHSYVNGRLVNGLMTWKDRDGASGSASDGDIDIAFALLMGHAQWPSGNYKTAADAMAARILSDDIVDNVVRGGNNFKTAPFNPSYFAPAAFRKFGASFSGAITKNYELVTANVTAATSGIPTDWADAATGAPSGPGAAQVTSEIIDTEGGVTYGAMGYDSARVPWRLGLDVCLGGGNTTALKAIIDRFAAKYDGGASIDLLKAGWYKRKDGAVHPAAINLQASYIGPMAAGGMAMGNTAMRDRGFRVILDLLENGDFNHTYFPSTVGLLTLLMMSGNFPTPQ